jgi:hypothetical protein
MEQIEVPYLPPPEILMPPMQLLLVFPSSTVKGQLKYPWKQIFFLTKFSMPTAK